MAKKVDGWMDRNGGIHATELEADRVDARDDIERILKEAVSGYDYELDVDLILRERRALIAALQCFLDT